MEMKKDTTGCQKKHEKKLKVEESWRRQTGAW